MSSLRPVDMSSVTGLFQADPGYVMDLSNRTFAEFFARELDVGIDDPRYAAQGTDQPVFAVAGVWQRTAEGQRLHDSVAPIHPKAMVAVLEEADWKAWLSCPLDNVVGYQPPYPAARMTVRGGVFPTTI